ncbi:hypothetical protein ACFLU7_00125 [Chloroflexota bacterium]
MVSWQITATTIYCNAVDDEVTLLVPKDWLVKCTGYSKYGEVGRGVTELLKKSRRLKCKLECEGPECYRVIQYKEKLLAEEAKNE